MSARAGITSWASWTSGGVAINAAPVDGADGALGAWAQAPALSAVHPRARRPHPSAKALVQLATTVLGERRPADLGLLLGSASGSAGADREYERELASKGQGFGSPSLFVYTLPTAPLGEVSIALQTRGPLLTVSAGLASGMSAVARAIEWVDSGNCERVLCGGFEFGIGADHLSLFLVEAGAGRRVSASTGFALGGSGDTRAALTLARSLAAPAPSSVVAADPLGFHATVHLEGSR